MRRTDKILALWSLLLRTLGQQVPGGIVAVAMQARFCSLPRGLIEASLILRIILGAIAPMTAQNPPTPQNCKGSRVLVISLDITDSKDRLYETRRTLPRTLSCTSQKRA